MKARLTVLAALLLPGVTAHAQEEEPLFFRQFSLEAAAGIAPLHTILNNNTLRLDRSLADQGQEPGYDGAWMPAMSLSAVWNTAPRWEMVLTGGLSWCHFPVVQYGAFGIDPKGKPRYDLSNRHPAGWKDAAWAAALFFQARRIWNPGRKVTLYSAFGGGMVLQFDRFHWSDNVLLAPVPSITPIAVRFGTGHLTFFLENTYSPAATMLDAGLGWTF